MEHMVSLCPPPSSSKLMLPVLCSQLDLYENDIQMKWVIVLALIAGSAVAPCSDCLVFSKAAKLGLESPCFYLGI